MKAFHEGFSCESFWMCKKADADGHDSPPRRLLQLRAWAAVQAVPACITVAHCKTWDFSPYSTLIGPTLSMSALKCIASGSIEAEDCRH